MTYEHWVKNPIAPIPAAISTLPDQVCPVTATPLPSNPCSQVTIVALPNNTGDGSSGNPWVRVGGKNIGATEGTPLTPGTPAIIHVNNTNLIYIFGNGTDKVAITWV